jgi:hypothetical protein
MFDIIRRNTTPVTQYSLEWSGFRLSQELSTFLLKGIRCGQSMLDTTLQKAFRLLWSFIRSAIKFATKYFYLQ